MELRRHSRVPFIEPVTFVRKGSETPTEGRSHDISLGGMFVETPSPAPFGSDVIVHVKLPAHAQAFALPGVVRWVGDGGMGVQFGLIGARETHAITELVAKAGT